MDSAGFGSPGAVLDSRILFAALVGAGYAVGLDRLLQAAVMPELWQRSMIAVLLMTPLCLALGLPFPRGIARVKRQFGDKKAAIFFAVNCAAGSLAIAAFTLMVPLIGLFASMLAGAGLYLIAALSIPGLSED